MTQPRKLSFKDRWLLQLQEVVETDVSLDNLATFEDQTTPKMLHVEWSQEMYTRIISCMTVGAELAYPFEAQQIYYDFLRIMNGTGMTCEDVADCIESNSDVLSALLQQLSANGFAPGGNSGVDGATNVTMSPSHSADNLLPSDYVCSDNQLMATARHIVQAFDGFVQDFFDQVEFLTNPAELVDITTDGIPVADSLGNIAAFTDWMIQNVREFYLASYDSAAEQEIACAIYCAMVVDCELTYDMLVSILDELQVVEYPSPSDTADFAAIAEWAMGLDLSVGVATVAAFHLLIALAMKFGSGTVFEMAGLVGLKTVIGGSVGLLDTSWTECDCAEETPTAYWMLYNDFRIGTAGVRVGAGTPGSNGIQATSLVSGSYWSGISWDDLGATYAIRNAAIDEQRYGSAGAATDSNFCDAYSGVNNTGTNINIGTRNNIASNGNSIVTEYDHHLTPVNARSVRWVGRDTGTPVVPTNFERMIRVVVYGSAGASDTKPPGSVWVDALPTTGNYFPSP